MGQSQPKLKIANSSPNDVLCVITTPGNASIQQAIAANSTLTLNTSQCDHTISVYPAGTTVVDGVRPAARYDLSVFSEEAININQKDGFLNISRQIGTLEKDRMPDLISNKTGETIVVVVTDHYQKSFEQVLLNDETYQCNTIDFNVNISVRRPGQEDVLATESFVCQKRLPNAVEYLYYHWEATVTKVEGVFKLEVKNIQHHSVTHTHLPNKKA